VGGLVVEEIDDRQLGCGSAEDARALGAVAVTAGGRCHASSGASAIS
jgi:hypothetical protein